MRGKLEAVIYAAEEPVTLAQLTALFGEEALAERAAAGSAEATARSEFEEQPIKFAESGEAVKEGSRDDAEANEGPRPDIAADTAERPVLLGDPDADRRAAPLRNREAREEIRRLLDGLMAEYGDDRGMEIREIAGGYRVATKPEYHDAVRAFARSLKPPMKLTLQALETLAVIAYKQPVTAPEVSEIRGVDSGGVLASLMGRKLVTTAGRKQVVGRPILYKTTKEFLLRFGLKDLAELPSMEEFEKMASELAALGEEPLPAGDASAGSGGPREPDDVPAEEPDDVPDDEQTQESADESNHVSADEAHAAANSEAVRGASDGSSEKARGEPDA